MDKGKFITILGNLIENAFARASHKRPQILVFLSDGADHILIEVEDSGDGIPEGDRSGSFKSFIRQKRQTTAASASF